MDFGHTREKALRIQGALMARVVRRCGAPLCQVRVPMATAAGVPNQKTSAELLLAREGCICLSS